MVLADERLHLLIQARDLAIQRLHMMVLRLRRMRLSGPPARCCSAMRMAQGDPERVSVGTIAAVEIAPESLPATQGRRRLLSSASRPAAVHNIVDLHRQVAALSH